jgi:GT2 family glycosyltransferase
MIKIHITEETIKISGHANYANYGHDIVCSAVSSIVTTSINGILAFKETIIVEEETISQLLNHLKKKELAVIAPVVKEPSVISRGWRLPTFFSELIANIPFFRRYEMSLLAYKEKDYQKELTQVEVVKGCFFIIKKEALEAIDLFDEHTFLYYEEIIMGKKLKDKNLKTYIDNKSTVIHALSQSVDKSVKKINKFKYLKESQYYYEREINKMGRFKLFVLRLFYYLYLGTLKMTLLFRR